jgi:hypothetical protein
MSNDLWAGNTERIINVPIFIIRVGWQLKQQFVFDFVERSAGISVRGVKSLTNPLDLFLDEILKIEEVIRAGNRGLSRCGHWRESLNQASKETANSSGGRGHPKCKWSSR